MLLQLNKNDLLYDMKCNIWYRDSSLPVRRIRVAIADNENFRALFALLRIIHADQADIDGFIAIASTPTNGAASSSLPNYRSIRDAHFAVSIRNETKALQHLSLICDEYLSKYPNSFESDCRRLASTELAPFSNERHAVIQVKGEKEVLLFYRDLATIGQQVLRLRDMSLVEEEMNNIRLNKHQVVYQYIRNNAYRLRVDEQRRIRSPTSSRGNFSSKMT